MSVLMVTPGDDRMARRAAEWARRLQDRFSFLIRHEARSRLEVERLLAAGPDLLYFGHGEPDALVASPGRFRQKESLIDASSLPNGPGQVVVAIACWSGDKLGPAVTDPARAVGTVDAYIGWLDEVGWPPGLAEPIDDAVVEGLEPLLEGGSVAECGEALRAAFEKAHDRYRSASGINVSRVQAHFGKMHAMYWHARLVALGQESARLDIPSSGD